MLEAAVLCADEIERTVLETDRCESVHNPVEVISATA
jgi:hypothetical protein